MIGAGRLDRLVQFQARPALSTDPGASRGSYADIGEPVWAYFVPGNAVRMYFGNFRVYVPSGMLTARTEDVAQITASNRFVMEGQGYQVRAVLAPDRRTGVTVLDVIGAQDEAAYAREIDVNGEAVALRRGQPASDFGPVRAFITTYTPQELAGNVQEGDRKAILLAADVAACGIPLPLKAKQDRIVFEGRPMVIQFVDDMTHRVGGDLIAYECRVSG